MGLNMDFIDQYLPWYIDAAVLTIRIAFWGILAAFVIGVICSVAQYYKTPFIKGIVAVYIEISRNTPQLVLLFIAYFGVTRAFGWNLSAEASAIIVFTLWGTAEMGDLVRGALLSIPSHQYDSAAALGMTKHQTFLHVIIPQTLRRLLPPTINLTTRMIKTTSLVVLIGMTEVLKVGKQIIDANGKYQGYDVYFAERIAKDLGVKAE